MMAPPPQGDVRELLPDGIGNPEAWACVLAWDAWRTFSGQVLDQFLGEVQLIRGIPA